MAFYITGDCHGDFLKIKFFCKHHKTNKDDVMIILGDFGVNLWIEKPDVKNKRMLAQMPLPIYFM